MQNDKAGTSLTRYIATTVIAISMAMIAGCYSHRDSSSDEVVPTDGEIALPLQYQSWRKFVEPVDKASGHVREI